jgi:hypothetical protein
MSALQGGAREATAGVGAGSAGVDRVFARKAVALPPSAAIAVRTLANPSTAATESDLNCEPKPFLQKHDWQAAANCEHAPCRDWVKATERFK